MAIAVDREGLKLKAYKCPAGVWTIGIGTTRYPNGVRVKEGDTCTEAQAYEWLQFDMSGAAKAVDDYTRDDLNQNQFDVLCDFVYNKGIGAYRDSTLRRLVNAGPNDARIRAEFAKWVYAGDGSHNGKDDDNDGIIDEPGEKQRLNGLVRRSQMWADLYFAVD